MIKAIKSRTQNVLSNEVGASNVEIIIWIAVVLVIGAALFLFGGTIKDKVTGADNSVSGMQTNQKLQTTT